MSDLKFVRWGGLSSVKQKGYDPAMPTEHCPPARRGIYAFVYPHIERFLIGSSVFKPHRMQWVRDAKGNRINALHPDYAKLVDQKGIFTATEKKRDEDEDYDENKWFLCRHAKFRVFEYRGDIWHHLKHRLKPFEIKTEKGAWVKSSYDDYKRALKAEVSWMKSFKHRHGYGYSNDHLEVFIEKV